MALTTVNSDGVKDDSIKNIDVKSDAAIAGSKIAPDFGSQDITSSGKINIGSSTHTTRKLAIHDTTNAAIVIEGASNGSSSILLADENDEDVGFISYNHATDDLSLTAADNIILTSGAGAKLQIRDGNTTGNIKFNAVNSAENANVSLEIAATDTLFFNGGTQKLCIKSGGNVGIGEVDPSEKLEVSGTIKLTNYLKAAGDLLLCADHDDSLSGSALRFCVDGEAAAEKMRIDSNGKVGINKTSPSSALDVNGEISLPFNNTLRWLESDGTVASDIYTNSSNTLIFRNNSGGQTANLDNSGNLELAGNLVLANTQGVSFSATADGTGVANVSELLDEYEEGSFTPTLSSGTSDTPSVSSYGGYVKIGKQVHFQMYLVITAATGNANQLKFGGLPFTSSTNTYSWGGACLIYQITMFDKGEDISFLIGASSSELSCYLNNGDALPGNHSSVNDLTAHVGFVGSYIAA